MTTPTIDLIGSKVFVPYVGTGIIADSRRFVEGTMYAVDIPINGRNLRVWRSYEQLKVVALRVVKMQPAINPFIGYLISAGDALKSRITVPNFNEPRLNGKVQETPENVSGAVLPTPAPELPIVVPELTNNHADLIERDNASPEPRETPVLRLFRAQVMTHRVEMVA